MKWIMDFFDGFDRVFTSAFNIFFGLLWFAVVILGGAASWVVLGLLEYSVVLQVLGAIAGGLVSGAVAWVVFQFMRAGAGWL
ncbi:MAG: hypothetical protein AAFR74_05330 [Pseudomonadota bacterium]